MDKLTIEHLAGYLPFKLNVLLEDKVGQFTTIYIGQNAVQVCTNDYQMYTVKITDTKPLLLPLSYLTKEITHEGLTFVPMVALFNLRFASGAYNILSLNESSNIHDMVISWDNVQSIKSTFYYNIKDYSFGLLEKNMHQRLPFQHQMFQKLHEWHFDIHGLIDKGLAIDNSTINTVK